MKQRFFNVLAVVALVLWAATVCIWLASRIRGTGRTTDQTFASPLLRDSASTSDREALLNLPCKEFDQTPASGWRRTFGEFRNCSEGAALLESYLQRHSELAPDQRAVLHCHAGQMLAFAGMTDRAIAHFDQAYVPDGSPNTDQDWNHYIEAQKAFLSGDRKKLEDSRQQIHGTPLAAGADFLLEHFGQSLADALGWQRPCSVTSYPADASPEHRAAAQKLARAFGLSVEASPGDDIRKGCVWLEIRSWGSAVPLDGYIILHDEKGTVISASSQQWLDAAVDRFIASSRKRNGQREAPTILMTSFRLAQ